MEYHLGGIYKKALLIKDLRLPNGFDPKMADLMVLIPSGYPGSALDMFYFDPHLKRLDGSEIHALAEESHFERLWQRWSRHYQWEAGKDSLVGHVEFVKRQLHDELRCL